MAEVICYNTLESVIYIGIAIEIAIWMELGLGLGLRLGLTLMKGAFERQMRRIQVKMP